MATKLKMLNFKVSAEEQEEFAETARQLGVTQTDAFRLAHHALRLRVGFVKDELIEFHERLARQFGDGAVLTFTVNGIDRLNVDVTVDGTPVTDLVAHVLFAMAAWEGGQDFKLPDEATIIAKDEPTGIYFTIGRVKLEEGATRKVELADMSELSQAAEDDKRTPKERRDAIESNARFREALRAARGYEED
jgi:hypothetical protein